MEANGSPGLRNFTSFRIGSHNYRTNFNFWGDFAELVMTQGQADQDTKDRIEGYLAWKWGAQASLRADHPYKNAAPIA